MNGIYTRSLSDITKKGKSMSTKKQSNPQPGTRNQRPAPPPGPPGKDTHPLNKVAQVSYTALVKAVSILAEGHLNVISSGTGLAVEDILKNAQETDDESRNPETD